VVGWIHDHPGSSTAAAADAPSGARRSGRSVVQTSPVAMADTPRKQAFAFPGWLVAGAVVCGLAGLVCGCVAALKGDFVGGGACFAAGAVAFGLLANAVLRD